MEEVYVKREPLKLVLDHSLWSPYTSQVKISKQVMHKWRIGWVSWAVSSFVFIFKIAEEYFCLSCLRYAWEIGDKVCSLGLGSASTYDWSAWLHKRYFAKDNPYTLKYRNKNQSPFI